MPFRRPRPTADAAAPRRGEPRGDRGRRRPGRRVRAPRGLPRRGRPLLHERPLGQRAHAHPPGRVPAAHPGDGHLLLPHGLAELPVGRAAPGGSAAWAGARAAPGRRSSSSSRPRRGTRPGASRSGGWPRRRGWRARDAVCGVRLRRRHREWATGLIEFVVVGTAVRSERFRFEDAPALSNLSGQDLNKLVRHGYWPVGLVAGTTVAYVATGRPQQFRLDGPLLEPAEPGDARLHPRHLRRPRARDDAPQRSRPTPCTRTASSA